MSAIVHRRVKPLGALRQLPPIKFKIRLFTFKIKNSMFYYILTLVFKYFKNILSKRGIRLENLWASFAFQNMISFMEQVEEIKKTVSNKNIFDFRYACFNTLFYIPNFLQKEKLMEGKFGCFVISFLFIIPYSN